MSVLKRSGCKAVNVNRMGSLGVIDCGHTSHGVDDETLAAIVYVLLVWESPVGKR